MTCSTILLMWFSMPLLGMTFVRIMAAHLASRRWATHGCASRPTQVATLLPVTLRQLPPDCAVNTLIAVMASIGPTLNSVNEHWQYAPIDTTPFSYWYLPAVAGLGGALSSVLVFLSNRLLLPSPPHVDA